MCQQLQVDCDSDQYIKKMPDVKSLKMEGIVRFPRIETILFGCVLWAAWSFCVLLLFKIRCWTLCLYCRGLSAVAVSWLSFSSRSCILFVLETSHKGETGFFCLFVCPHALFLLLIPRLLCDLHLKQLFLFLGKQTYQLYYELNLFFSL